jgi:hypothetical protein
MTAVLNSDLAQHGADTGMLVAASHADRAESEWTEQAEVLFKLYARFHPDGFMTEDVRVWSVKLGFTPPPDNRAWGYVTRSLAKQGYIEATGYGKQRSATCHGSPKTIWKLK